MIEKNYRKVKEASEGKAVLCVVSKTRSFEEIMTYYEAGERVFAENRAAELKKKAAVLPSDIQWQFIGHLQTNKVRMIMPYVSCIQSLDSRRLADEIEKAAAGINRTIDVLLEFHIAEEDTNKTGASEEDAFSLLAYCRALSHLCVKGIMVMGPHTDDVERIRAVFEKARTLFEALRAEYPDLTVLSMGMSSDYETALSCGSTMIRIGTMLFEEE